MTQIENLKNEILIYFKLYIIKFKLNSKQQWNAYHLHHELTHP